MSNVGNNTTEQLLVLKALTRSTGCLHEGQILQLKMWTYLLYPKVKVKYEIQIDQTLKSVKYLLSYPRKVPAGLAGKSAELEKDFHWLLGDEWLLEIVANSKRVFRGTRQIKAGQDAQKKVYTPFIKAVDEYADSFRKKS